MGRLRVGEVDRAGLAEDEVDRRRTSTRMGHLKAGLLREGREGVGRGGG